MITGKHESKIKRNLIIKSNKICNNSENGINILDYIEGSVDIEDCFINENLRNGVNISVSIKSLEQSGSFKNKISTNTSLRGMSLVKSCEIKRNKEYGLMISFTYCAVYTSNISDNILGQTFYPNTDENSIICNNEQFIYKNKCKNCAAKRCFVM